jgi:lysophospholipase L1-like esterase
MYFFWVTTAALIALFLFIELGLRLFLGFGSPLIYIADPQIGYLLAPSQQTRRFGNAISINQYSMRSPEINAARPDQGFRVLLLGDSIINGGWWTDQSNTVSALLQQQLQAATRSPVEVLNASANSWSPRNELAYLQRFGSFQAQVVVLVINTDDLFGAAPTSHVVGRDRNYPDRKPLLAVGEVWQRYLMKAQPLPEGADQLAEKDRVGANLAAIQQIQSLAQHNNAKFILCITPLLRELGSPGPRDYERDAHQRLQAMTQSKNIILVDFLPIFNTLPNPQTLYHDHIHFNLSGNQQITKQIMAQIQKL